MDKKRKMEGLTLSDSKRLRIPLPPQAVTPPKKKKMANPKIPAAPRAKIVPPTKPSLATTQLTIDSLFSPKPNRTMLDFVYDEASFRVLLDFVSQSKPHPSAPRPIRRPPHVKQVLVSLVPHSNALADKRKRKAEPQKPAAAPNPQKSATPKKAVGKAPPSKSVPEQHDPHAFAVRPVMPPVQAKVRPIPASNLPTPGLSQAPVVATNPILQLEQQLQNLQRQKLQQQVLQQNQATQHKTEQTQLQTHHALDLKNLEATQQEQLARATTVQGKTDITAQFMQQRQLLLQKHAQQVQQLKSSHQQQVQTEQLKTQQLLSAEVAVGQRIQQARGLMPRGPGAPGPAPVLPPKGTAGQLIQQPRGTVGVTPVYINMAYNGQPPTKAPSALAQQQGTPTNPQIRPFGPGIPQHLPQTGFIPTPTGPQQVQTYPTALPSNIPQQGAPKAHPSPAPIVQQFPAN